MRMKAARVAVVTSAVALALAACSSVTDEQPSPEEGAETEITTPEPDPKADEVEEKMDEAAGPDADEITYDGTLDVIATREASFSSRDIKLELNHVKVSGELMTVLFTVTNVGGDRWQIASSLDSGEYGISLSDGEGDDEDDVERIDGGTTDGVIVTDDENGMVYRAAYDSGGSCLCSSNLSSSFLDEDKSLVLSTRFAAPPEDVETVTVEIPHFGTFDDIPLTR